MARVLNFMARVLNFMARIFKIFFSERPNKNI
jgi:hypothetical protein